MTSEQLFELKQKFLQQVPHPKLILKNIQVLANHLGIDFQSNVAGNHQGLNIIDFLAFYDAQLLKLKLEIANASDESELFQGLAVLYHLHQELIERLADHCPEQNDVLTDEIKQSSPFDVYAIQKELRLNHLDETEIKDYLYKQFNAIKQADWGEFTKSVIRANKIVQNA